MMLTEGKRLLEQVSIEQFKQNVVLLTAKDIEIPRVWILELVNVIQTQEQEIERLQVAYDSQHDAQINATKRLGKAYAQIQSLQEQNKAMREAIQEFIDKTNILTGNNEELLVEDSSYWKFKQALSLKAGDHI